nr:integrase, catalytic region, zinc finger, CCHC-type, peptidase aspartic, catalytic [Tanacetum cinerariifolium]
MVEQAKLKLDLVRKPVDHTDYRSMIGSLMYVNSSRPDIMFATCMCARYQANPIEHHVAAVNRIFRYLKWTINLGLWYPKDSSFELTDYSDADHAGCHLDRKSTSCRVQFLGDKLMRTQLTDYGFFYDKVPIYCDSKNAIAISCNPVQYTRTKHIDVRISPVSKMPFRKKPRDSINICLWIIDSGCSKHMTGNHALLTNFVEKFLEMVHFGNNDFAVIAGYGDVVIGSMTIKKVYYAEGLGHNLFSVGQFYNKGLEIAFRKSTCFVRNKDGVDLLTGDRSSNLYTIALNEVASNFSTCFLAKASSSQSWLWHQRLSHSNFAPINNLVKNNLVQGLPKMKFEKDHLCSACEQGKIHREHHKSKTDFASNKPLYLLHMDLYGPMRIRSINGKRYVLVVVDDYSRTPQQNGVVERRNRTLVEAARTMLTFANLPSFLWAEAIATACFTQNRSTIHKGFDKTPYELMNKRKPNIKFFRVFGCRCYLLNDYEEVGKLKAKGGIEVFVGYLKESAAFIIYNKRTRCLLDASTSFHDPSNVHTYYQPYPHEKKWTKDHPLHKIIGDPKLSV